jgi:hypothetical protein
MRADMGEFRAPMVRRRAILAAVVASVTSIAAAAGARDPDAADGAIYLDRLRDRILQANRWLKDVHAFLKHQGCLSEKRYAELAAEGENLIAMLDELQTHLDDMTEAKMQQTGNFFFNGVKFEILDKMSDTRIEIRAALKSLHARMCPPPLDDGASVPSVSQRPTTPDLSGIENELGLRPDGVPYQKAPRRQDSGDGAAP